MTSALATPGIQSAEIVASFPVDDIISIAPVVLDRGRSLVDWIANAARVEALLEIKAPALCFGPSTTVIRFVRSECGTAEEVPAQVACTHAIQAIKAESLHELDTRGLGPLVREAVLRPFTRAIEPHGAAPTRTFEELLRICRGFAQVSAHAFERRCPDDLLEHPDFGSLRIEAARKRVQSVLNRWLFSVQPPESQLDERGDLSRVAGS